MTTRWPALNRLLRTDPSDAGCDGAFELLHVYAELVAVDARAARVHYSEVAAHLDACGPCDEDLEGLLEAVRSLNE